LTGGLGACTVSHGVKTCNIAELRIFAQHPTYVSGMTTRTTGDSELKVDANEWGMLTHSTTSVITPRYGIPSTGLLSFLDTGIYANHNNCFGNCLLKGDTATVSGREVNLDDTDSIVMPSFSQTIAGGGLTCVSYFKIRQSGELDDIVYLYGSVYHKAGGLARLDRPFIPITTADSFHIDLYGGTHHTYTPPYPFEVSLRHASSGSLKVTVDFKNKNLSNNAASAGGQNYQGYTNLGYSEIQEGILHTTTFGYSLNTWYVLTVVLDDAAKKLRVFLTSSNITSPNLIFNISYAPTLTSNITFNKNGYNPSANMYPGSYASVRAFITGHEL
jgi:hypothetical protein